MAKIKVILSIIIMLIILQTVFAAVKTYYVVETDFVTIKPETFDPDSDKVTVSYSAPFDEEGEWQTTYDDAGEYDVAITAVDEVGNKDIENILVVVRNKNQAPYITDNKVSVKETQVIDLKYLVKDADNDALSYIFQAPFDKNGFWETGFEDAGFFTTEFTVSDGNFNTKGRVEIEILPTNKEPEINTVFSEERVVTIKEDEILKFFVTASDIDKDKLSYLWELNNKEISEDKKGEYYFNFENSGEHTLKVTVSDGQKEITKQWKIIVKNVNRKPTLAFLPLTVKEGEKVILDLPDFDDDRDPLSYSFEKPFNKEGEWQTGFEDAGVREVLVTVSDGEFIENYVVEITIIDVDRAPILNLPAGLIARENEELEWKIDSTDPDRDVVKIQVLGLPQGAKLNEKTVTWTPGFNFITRRGGFFSNLLSKVRLEHFFLKKKELILTVKSCGKDLCNKGEVTITVYNTNRPPVLNNMEDLTIKETESLELFPSATDPDGDIVKYYFSEPVNRKTGMWKTNYEDQGQYEVEITASDGRLSDTSKVNVDVMQTNRAPTLEIKNDKIVVNEDHTFSFPIIATDPDGDELKVWVDFLPEGASFNNEKFEWKPSFDTVQNRTKTIFSTLISKSSYLNKRFNKDKKTIWLTFIVSDGEIEVIHPVQIIVKNVNRIPAILDFLPSEVVEVPLGTSQVFHVAAKDWDEDNLEYKWSFSGISEKDVEGTDTIERKFMSPGKKEVKVVVTDGLRKAEKVWQVNVVGDIVYKEVKPQVEVGFPEVDPSFRVYVVQG